MGETFGDTFLVERVGEQINFELRDGFDGAFVVTDVRYAHEATEIRSWSRRIPGARVFLARVYGRGPGHHAHCSEQQWDKIAVDFEVDNTGDLDDLHRQAEHVVNLARAVPRN